MEKSFLDNGGEIFQQR